METLSTEVIVVSGRKFRRAVMQMDDARGWKSGGEAFSLSGRRDWFYLWIEACSDGIGT